jgi:chromosome partitioning protein
VNHFEEELRCGSLARRALHEAASSNGPAGPGGSPERDGPDLAKIIAIANQKGGVGKTTTAINLGAALAVAERRTLILDADPQSNATRGLGFGPDPERPSIYDCLLNGADGQPEILKTAISRLELLPSERDLFGAEVELVGAPERERRMADALGTVHASYDYILIDCPPSLGLLTLNALVAADSILVPVQCEYLALEGLSEVLSTLKRVAGTLNPSLVLEGVLLTMFDDRTNLSHQVADEIRGHLGEKVFKTVIPRNVRLGEAPSFGKPILTYDLKSKGAEAYLSLAREIVER